MSFVGEREHSRNDIAEGAFQIMQFSVARADVIRAINQRWLLKFWNRSRGDFPVPTWQTVEAENLASMSANLSFLDVARAGGETKFVIRFHGATIAQVYGLTDCRGRTLDEIVPASAVVAYQHVLDARLPVYTIYDMSDRDGRLVHHERLLLPFARDGKTVDRILASFEFFCEDGAFDNREILKSQTAQPALRLSATIALQTLA